MLVKGKPVKLLKLSALSPDLKRVQCSHGASECNYGYLANRVFMGFAIAWT